MGQVGAWLCGNYSRALTFLTMSRYLNPVGKLIVLTSHPIQYQAPLWREVAKTKLDFEVWFLTDQGVRRTNDRGFGKSFSWDVNLLEGYRHRFLDLKGEWDMGHFGGIRVRASMTELLRDAGATALWVEGWRFKPFWDAVRAAKKLKIPVFLRGETSDKIPEKGGVFGVVRKIMLQRLFAKVDYFLTIGQASRRFYLKHGVLERKLLEAPYCVDNEFFWREAERHRKDGTENIRRTWNIPENAKVVLFCGKFISKKRPMDLVEAAKLHVTRFRENGGEPWHLLFVGSGELREELRRACAVHFDAENTSNKMSPTQNEALPPVSFVGFLNQSEISKAYAVADVLVLPSDAWETWGLVVNEATAAGVPTAVSDACGCSEDFARENSHTRIYPWGNVGSLHQAIKDVLSLNMNRRVISKSVDYFSPRKTATEIMRVLSCK